MTAPGALSQQRLFPDTIIATTGPPQGSDGPPEETP